MADSDTHQNLTYAVFGLTLAHVVASVVARYQFPKYMNNDRPAYSVISVIVCITIVGVASAFYHKNKDNEDTHAKQNGDMYIAVIALALLVGFHDVLRLSKKATLREKFSFTAAAVYIPVAVMFILACIVSFRKNTAADDTSTSNDATSKGSKA